MKITIDKFYVLPNVMHIKSIRLKANANIYGSYGNMTQWNVVKVTVYKYLPHLMQLSFINEVQ